MSKRELKKYLSELKKKHLEEQIVDLYDRFKEVKTFYDFAFNPKEKKLVDESKFKISKEYFPVSSRKPKRRRSVAQKIIKQFKLLGVEPALIADLMLYNIEVAQAYCEEYPVKQDSFYVSMLKSFTEALVFISDNGLKGQMKDRLNKIVDATIQQNWFNYRAFEREME